MKHLLKLTLLLLALLLPTVISAHDFEVDGIYYNINGNEATVTSGSDSYSGDVIIPAVVAYNGTTYSVTAIGENAFYNCSGLTSITIPNSVTSIGNYAFESCYGLTNLTIPCSVTSIGQEVFSYCSSLVSIIVENGNPIYDSRDNCNAIIETASNTLIRGCKNTIIPNSITSIEDYSFFGCFGLESITIPNSVTSIGVLAFGFCSDITSIIVESGNPVYDSRNNCNAIIMTATNTLIEGCKSTVIPKSVTAIGDFAFYGRQALESFSIPHSVTSIGNGAFRGNFLYDVYCYNSKPSEISMGQGVFDDGNTSYYNRTLHVPYGSRQAYLYSENWQPYFGHIGEMEPNIEFSDANVKALCVQNWDMTGDNELSKDEAAAVTSLGTVFKNNTTITSFNELEFFTGLTSVNDEAFYGCTSLTSVTIPNSITAIGNSVFSGCTNLTSVTIPNSVTSIGSSAFSGCSSLTDMFSHISNPSEVSIGYRAFYLASGNYSNRTLHVPYRLSDVYMTNNNWQPYFGNIVEMESIIEFADANVKEICVQNWDTNGDGELSEAEAEAVTSIGTIFRGNISIRSFNELAYFTGLTSIDDYAFSDCYYYNNYDGYVGGLTSVTIPNSVTSIGNYAFNQCEALSSISIPNSVVFIGDYAFGWCKNLSMSLTIPKTLTHIGYGAFSGCGFVNNIIVENGNPVYDSRDNCYAIIETASNTLIRGCRGTHIPNSVTSIGDFAFNWSGVESINIPSSVTSIGERAFSWCILLGDIYCYILNPSEVTIGQEAFDFYSNSCTLHVPNGTIDAYNRWQGSFDDIVEMEPGVIEFADANVKAICVQNWDTNGDGELSEAEAAAVTSLNRVFSQDSTIISFDELEYFTGLSAIGNSEFYYCINLTCITIPNTVKTIEFLAFRNCYNLSNITIPNSVKTIDHLAFSDCSSLKSLTIGNSVTSIGSGAFYACSSLTSVSIPNSVKTIGNGAFQGCSGLAGTLTIPNSVTSIGRWAFQGCTSLETLYYNAVSCGDFSSSTASEWPFYNLNIQDIIIGDNVKSIPDHLASDLSRLTNLTVGKSVTSIGTSAFSGCSGLTYLVWKAKNCSSNGSMPTANIVNVTIGEEVETIPKSFVSGSKITTVTIPNSVSSIGNSAFSNCTKLARVNSSDVGSWSKINFGNATANPLYYARHLYLNDEELTDLVVPAEVEAIGNYAFYNCNLNSVNIHQSVTSVGTQAFNNCSSIETVTCEAETPPAWDDIAMFTTNVYNHTPLYVPMGSVRTYQADQCWGQFANIIGKNMDDEVLATGISLNQSQMSLMLGGCSQLVATVLPESTTNKVVTWVSSAPEVASVDNNGLVTALAVGSATVTATTTDGSNLSASCVVAVTENLSDYDNYLSMEDVEAFHGDTIVIPVAMTNEASIISFQTDIFLPEGIELLKEDGEYIIDPSPRMTRTHSIMSDDVSNGAIRVLCYSSNYKPFTGNSGDDLFYLTVKVADNAEGDYTIQLKNTLLTTSNFEELAAPDVAANVNVKAYLLGDANNSGTVTVTDVVVTSQYILEQNPQPFIFEAADVNVDGSITVTDVSRIAWMVLNPTLNAPLRAPALWNNGDRMSGEGISIMAGETRRVSIALDNEVDYAAFQLDMLLPEGLTATNFALTDRAGSHAFDVNTLQSGKTRALCYSPAMDGIRGHEGALLTFDVTATGTVKGDITVDGIELVTTACQTVRLDGFTITVNNTSIVNELASGKSIAKVEYFNLAGQRIEQPADGVTLIVTTYTDGTCTTSKILR